MVDQSKNKPRFRWLRFLRQCVLLALLILTIAAAGSWVYFTRPHRVASMAAHALETLSGADVAIETGQFHFNGTVHLQNVVVRVPGIKSPGAELFRAREVWIHCERLALLRGAIKPVAISIVAPRISLTEHVSAGGYNFLRLARRRPAPAAGLTELPQVMIRDGLVRCAEVVDGEYEVIGAAEVGGWFTPDPMSPNVYRFELARRTHEGRELATPLIFKGRLDLETQSFTANLEGLAFNDRNARLLPRRLRYLWRLLDPAGDIPKVQLDYALEGGPRGEVHLENVALTLPQLTRQGSAIPTFDEGPSVLEVLTGEDNTALYRLDPEQPRIHPGDYQARLSDVSGVLKFDDRGFHLENLTGRALDEDVAYEINGHVYGYTEQAPFELTAKTEQIRIPRRPRYLVALPGDLQRLFRKFSPAGDAKAAITLRRSEPGGPVAIQGRVDVLDAEARYFEFPYPLHNLNGTIEFTNDEIRLVDLVADAPGGGTIGLRGRVWPPGRHAAVDLTIVAADVPWDDVLRRALPADRRSAVDKFFHQPSYDRLAEAGLLDQPDGKTFTMGGRADATIRITAPAGPRVEETITGTLDCRDGGFVVKYFPYPIRDAEGIIRFDNDRVSFEEVKGRGPNGGTVTFDGSIREVRVNGKTTAAPDIQIEAGDVPVDELLYAALPESARPLVRRLNVDGTFNIGGRIFTRPDHQPDIDLMLTLAGATAHPVEAAKKLTDLSGNIGITLDRTEIHEITADYGNGRLNASGVLNWASAGPPDARIRILAENMTCEPSLMHLVSAANPEADLTGLWKRYEPAGRFDAQLDYAQSGDEKRSYRIGVEPKLFSFNLDDRRVELDELSGRVDWRPGRFDLTGLKGKVGPSTVEVSGEVLTEAGWQVSLRDVKVASPKITPMVRLALPKPMRQILDGLDWKGDFQADLSTLRHHPDVAAGERTRVVGEVRTTDGSLELGLPIRHMAGVISVDVRQQANQTWPQIDLKIDAERLEAAGREVTDFHAQLRNNEAGEDVLLPVIHGNVCGGELTGTGALNLADHTYQVRLTVNNGDLSRFVTGADGEEAEDAEAQRNAKTPATTGKVAADLVVEGVWDSPDNRRARGEILVQDAELYDLPLALGLLNLAHLSLPTTRSFDRAAVSYYMEGDKVRFERLMLDSPQVRLQGEGTMRFSTQELDLALTSANPSAPGLGPMTELIDGLRNQFITIHVTGTLEDPETKVKQFSGIARAWEDVFGDGAE